ncbi:capsular polysaccharide export protein, LipB/KpsS family [Halovenus salina]|uniref:Capsule polysaccharide biosynthesis protein n=1 Tax=Halovenus salina TaxID=1510225 RepID=A0ABD5W2C1_9EURY|nr:hypothetical protein [Halovenus salina]
MEFLDLVGEEIQERGALPVYIPQNRNIAETAAKTLSSGQYRRDYLNHEPTTGLNALCEKYGIDSPKRLVFPQMVYDRSYDSPSARRYWLSGVESMDYKSYLDLLHRTLDFLDTLYENGDGGIPLQWQGAEILRRALQRVADYHDYPSVRASVSPLSGKIFLRSTEEMQFPSIEAATYEDMTQEERESAQELRETVAGNRKAVIEYPGQPETLFDNIQRKLQRIREYKHEIGPVAIDWLRRRVAKRALGKISKQWYMDEQSSRELIESTRYIFYPLHYFRESRVTMRAPAFYNQLWLIEYLSRSLPLGYELVVKDHPQQLGALPLSHVRAISRYSKAIAPTISGRDVITHADAVVTLNNTVGYEAIMYGKPVLTLADAFYSDGGYTHDLRNPDALPSVLDNAVTSEGLAEKEIAAFAHGVRESSYDGSWGDTRPENVETFAESITEYLGTR